jgi:cysteine/O-acetylserine efflux protein
LIEPFGSIGIVLTTSLFSLISFLLISSFTPGPSNISSASLAVLHGYKNTLKYQAGLAVAVFFMMLLSGGFSTALLSIFPALEPIMRFIGGAYILYLAFGILSASYTFTENDVEPLGFAHGFLLQILNPKLVIYAFTLFSAFLTSMIKSIAFLVLLAMLLAGISFCATSMWALFGTAIKTYLRDTHLRTIINIVLSLSLLYTALTLTNIL